MVRMRVISSIHNLLFEYSNGGVSAQKSQQDLGFLSLEKSPRSPRPRSPRRSEAISQHTRSDCLTDLVSVVSQTV
jgi:hypothetical protein